MAVWRQWENRRNGRATQWLGTKDAAARLGITLRSLYRFIDEGDLAAYKFGRVIRLKEEDVDRFIESCRIQPGQLEHLYPPLKVSEATMSETTVSIPNVSDDDEQ